MANDERLKPSRRRDLMRLLHEEEVSSQQEIVEALSGLGHEVTQATVSRDLTRLKALKVRVGDGFVYRLPDDVPRSGGDLLARELERNLAEFALDIRQAASLVVVETAPGHASAVARSIDLAGPDPVVGTVAGDDTILVATPSAAAAAALVESWLGHTDMEEES